MAKLYTLYPGSDATVYNPGDCGGCGRCNVEIYSSYWETDVSYYTFCKACTTLLTDDDLLTATGVVHGPTPLFEAWYDGWRGTITWPEYHSLAQSTP